MIEEFFRIFFKIVTNAPMLEQLKQNLELVVQENTEPNELNDSNQKYIWRIKRNKRRTRKELHVNTQIAGFQIKDTMLDLGSDVNILPRNTWEALGRPKLTYSPIQL